MATFSPIEGKMIQKYELALNRLAAGHSSGRNRPIAERGTPKTSEQEAVSAAANALAALWGKRQPRS